MAYLIAGLISLFLIPVTYLLMYYSMTVAWGLTVKDWSAFWLFIVLSFFLQVICAILQKVTEKRD